MEAKFSTPINRLSSRLSARGVTKFDAVAKASANIADLMEDNVSYIDDELENIRILLYSKKFCPKLLAQELYDSSNSIFATSALFGLDALGRGAYSLCELLSHFESAKGLEHRGG